MFSSSAQDLSASAAEKALNVENVECYVHQGDKVGASAVGKLSRIECKAKLHAHSHCSYCDMIALKLC